ncbi:MAG TPA: hypothetical protein VGM64_07850 [Lacunisphaera sp.]|jgi:hypothetical protein
MKRRVKITVIALAIIVGLGAVLLYFRNSESSRGPNSGNHLAHVDWLPASASDVSFYWNGDSLFPMDCYECTIPYEDMLKFARESGWTLVEKSPVRLSQWRHLLHLPSVGGNGDTYESALLYSTDQQNGGGIQVVFHKPSSRLFVCYSAN